jgi:tRNA pseudouridine38-40 synthase
VPRFFLYLEYDGSGFDGWQIQPNSITVQGELKRVLELIFRQPIEVMGSGRTDAGVHASHQVAHIDLDKTPDFGRFLRSLNALLPEKCKVWDIKQVHNNAHCRFDALSRSYEYRIIQRPSPLRDLNSWFLNQKLDIELLQKAAEFIPKFENFEFFSKPNPTNIGSTFCKIRDSYWELKSNDELVFHISSNRFLHHMVRYLVGSMVRIATSKLEFHQFEKILSGQYRDYVHLKAPAKGLCLSDIEYPESIWL